MTLPQDGGNGVCGLPRPRPWTQERVERLTHLRAAARDEMRADLQRLGSAIEDAFADARDACAEAISLGRQRTKLWQAIVVEERHIAAFVWRNDTAGCVE